MPQTLHEIMLRANTALFAQKMCYTVNAFCGEQCGIKASSLTKGFYKSSAAFTTFMHFAGYIQGDFIITLDMQTAGNILKKYKTTVEITNTTNESDSFSDLFTEIINVASGQTLPELEKKYGPLTLVPPSTVFGEIRFASVLSGNVEIESDSGIIFCTLSLNLASLRFFKDEKTLKL